MAYDLLMIRTSDFVRLDGRGKPDLVESRRALERVAKSCIDRGVRCALLDVRDVYSTLELMDMYNLVGAFHAMGFRAEHQLAVLHRYSGGEKAEVFATLATQHGWNVRAFDRFEDAIEWFTSCKPLN